MAFATGEGTDGQNVRGDRLKLDPLIPVLKNVLNDLDLKGPMRIALHALDSSALMHTTLTSLKNAPYALLSVGAFDDALSCRLRYAESAFLSTASLVYNFVWGLLCTVGSVATLGQVPMLTNQMQKRWIHTALSVAGIGVSLIGTLSPEWGVKANGGALLAIGLAASKWLAEDFVAKIPAVYQARKRELKAAALVGVGNDQQVYQREMAPLFAFLSRRLDRPLNSFMDLGTLIQDSLDHLPHLQVKVSEDVIKRNFEELFS